MPRALPLVLLLVVGSAAASWVALRSGSRPTVAPSAAAPVEPAQGEAHAPAVPARGDERSAVSKHAPAEGPATALTTTPTAPVDPTGAVLRVHVLDDDSATPLPEFALRVAPYEPQSEPIVLVTDVEGRAQSPPVVPRGLVELEHAPTDAAGPYPVRWQLLEGSALVDVAPGETLELEVRAQGPRLAVQVALEDADGRRVVGSTVRLVEAALLADGGKWWHYWRGATTDASGVATYHLHGDAFFEVPFAVLLAEPIGSQVSDVIYIDPPIQQGPYVLRLYRGSELVVTVLDVEGHPAEGTSVRARLGDPLRARYGLTQVTGVQGTTSFTPLAEGRYFVSVEDPRSRDRTLARDEVEVVLHERAELTLRLPEEEDLQLVVAGRVVGLDGEPPEYTFLLVSCDGETPKRLNLDPDGAFELRRLEPCESVVVSAVVSVYGDPVEPEEVRVPAGTRGLVFKTRAGPELSRVIFEIADARTGKPTPDDQTAIVIYREPKEGSRASARAFFGSEAGTVEVDFPPSPDLRWTVLVPGYEEQRGSIPSTEPDAEPEILRVRLHPGFRRELFVRDATNGARLGMVTVRDGSGRALGVTGSDGGIVLAAPEWPGELTFERPGYSSTTWNASRHWSTSSHQVWLCPAK